uniref:Uncharacterized protein n=1 Tax=Haemonchus contortus TaxID=6289 RepID=A0A7I5E530_HAECO
MGSFDRPSTKVATSKAKRRSGELHIPTKAPEFKQASCLVSMRSQSSRVPTRAPVVQPGVEESADHLDNLVAVVAIIMRRLQPSTTLHSAQNVLFALKDHQVYEEHQDEQDRRVP